MSTRFLLALPLLGVAALASVLWACEKVGESRARRRARKYAQDREHVAVADTIISSWKPHRDRYGRFATTRRFQPTQRL